MPSRLQQVLSAVILVALVLPWVNPFAPGPSSSVVPWLVSASCAVIAWAAYRLSQARAVQPLHWVQCIAAGWIAAALISSAIALFQYFGLASYLSPLANATGVGEAFANLRQRNQFASLTAIGMAALLWWAPGTRRGHAVAAMALLAVANAASASRTGLLQVVMLALFTGLWSGPDRRRRLELCLAAALAYLLAATLLPVLLEAITGMAPDTIWGRMTRGEGCSSRVVLWSNVLDLISARPWLGWGWGELDYAHYITSYPGARFCAILDNAHNLPLHLAVELGVPAAAIIGGAFLWWVVRAQPWRETDRTRQLAWSVLAVILLHSMLEYPLWYGPFQLAFVLSLGLLRPSSPGASSNASGHGWWAPVFQRALTLALIAAIALAAWDYRRISQIYLPPQARDADYRDDTLAHIRGSRLFQDHVRFAELTITPLTRDNAQWTFDTALALLHYSPEPRVVEKVIESAAMLGRDNEALAHLSRFRAAFPNEYAVWSATQRAAPAPASVAHPTHAGG